MTDEEVATRHMERVFAELREGVPTRTTQTNLSRLRLERDLDLRLIVIGKRQFKLAGVVDAFAEYDRLIDALVEDATGRQQPVAPELVERMNLLLEKRARESQEEVRSWIWVWEVGAALGLLTIVAAFSWSAGSDDSGWEWITLCVAGLGAVVAGLYTFRGATDLTRLTRWLLLALPLVVLVVATTLPQRGTGAIPAARVVAAVIVVALLGGLSLWILFREPGRRKPLSARLSVPLERLLFNELGETVDEARRIPLIRAELEELLARVQQEAVSQRVQGRWWAATFIVVGGLAAGLSGAAGVTATQADAESPWVVGLAIGGAGLTALVTAINPGGRWEHARTIRLACESLAQEVGVFVRVDLGMTANDRVGREKIDEIAVKYDALLGVQERARLEPISDISSS